MQSKKIACALWTMIAFNSLAWPSIAAEIASVDQAKVLLASIGFDRLMDSTIEASIASAARATSEREPSRKAAVDALLNGLRDRLISKKPDLVDRVARLYATKLTSIEIEQMIQFYKSDVGRKFVDTQVDLSPQLAAVSNEWTIEVSKEFAKDQK